MEIPVKIRNFVISFLLAEIFALIFVFTSLFYLTHEKGLGFLMVIQSKPLAFTELFVAGACFFTSAFFYIDLIRHPNLKK
ncbi:MAG TPA: hypothetical protein VIH31_02010 [Candidatus Paceibacterota bacterium]